MSRRRHSGLVGKLDDLAAVDADPIAALQVRLEGLDDAQPVGAAFGRLHLVQGGELEPAGDRVPQAQRSVTRRAGRAAPGRTAPARRGRSASARRSRRASSTRSCSALHLVVVVGSAIAASTTPGRGPISASSSRATAGSCGLRPSTCSAWPATRVPLVEQGHVGAAQQCADAHQRPAVAPLALPRVLLALDAIDLFEAEEAPVDGRGRAGRGPSRIHSDVWYAHGHMTSKWKSTVVTECGCQPWRQP